MQRGTETGEGRASEITIGNGRVVYMMTQKEFDEYIKKPKTITEKAYNENKELFEEAERQGKIQIRGTTSRITAGNIEYPTFKSYRIEPIE